MLALPFWMPAQACLGSSGVSITWMAKQKRRRKNRKRRKAKQAGRAQRMTRNPIYDDPEPYADPRRGVPPSPRKISLVGRLRLTQPVWLQMGLNSAAALHILQREPPGTFLVRRSNVRRCQVLSLRLPDNSSPAFVTTYRLHQERAVVFLEGSDLTFPSLLHLIAAYCSTPDILPVPLRLPRPIREASSCQQLEAIAHLGLEFWSSSLNTKESNQLALMDTTSLDPTRDSIEPAYGKPLRPQRHGESVARRQQFKSNLKVQVSTEAASPLSPPAVPPPPVPIAARHPPQFPNRPPTSNKVSPPSQGLAKLETYRVPRRKEKETGETPGPDGCLLAPSGQLRRLTEEDQSHFPWDFPTQESAKLGRGVRYRILES
ncbi:ras and Rab interactor 1 isoform X2 [Anolis sagrei]|uniref:ras and Rab interactor 1 isoform X2 n=1 Tax=Anolis sagrei TaxID=38937 RepID=UPI00351FCDC2